MKVKNPKARESIAEMGGHSIALTLEAGVKKDSGPLYFHASVKITESTICDLGHRNNCCQEVFRSSGGSLDQEGIMPLLSRTTDLKHHYGLILALVCMWLASVVASAIVFAAFD